MNESKICTCPSGDGSLRWPCPAHPAVEQAGGDERAAFELFVRKHCGMPAHIAVNWDAKFTNDAWAGWQARAALAQPSPVRSSLLINGYQLRAALDFIAPDGTAEQLESEACIEWRQQDADFLEAGLYAFCAEYPEEGGVLLDEEPTNSQPSPAQELAERGTQHRFSTTEQTCRHDFAGVWWNDNGETKTGKECRECGFFIADIAEAPELERPEVFGLERYRVERTGQGFWPYCVRAGDGTRELFVGHLKQCKRVAAQLATAFEDGKFVAGALRAENAKLSEALDRWPLIRDSLKLRLADALARVAALESKLAELEKREPVAWGAFHFGGKRDGKLYTHCETEAQIEAYILDMHRSSDSLTLSKGPLYAAPVDQAQHSVPEDIMRDAQRYRWLRDQQFYFSFSTENSDAGISSCTAGMSSRFKNLSWVDAAIDSAIAAAPGKEGV